jgi:hypothetical protein
VVSGNEGRKALNEAVFRQVNEQIRNLQQGLVDADREPLHIVCECDRIDCAERISVDARVYEQTRSDAALFFVVTGHEDHSIEDVVDTGGGYLIVRKRSGEPRRIAEETDPRS